MYLGSIAQAIESFYGEGGFYSNGLPAIGSEIVGHQPISTLSIFQREDFHKTPKLYNKVYILSMYF
jgi:hypothetical protein